MSANVGADGEGDGKREGGAGRLPGVQITLSSGERSLLPNHSTLPAQTL